MINWKITLQQALLPQTWELETKSKGLWVQFFYSQALVLCFSKYIWPQVFQNILLIPWKSHTMYFYCIYSPPQLLLGMGFILCLSSDCLKYNQKVTGCSHNSCHYCASGHTLPSRSLLQFAACSRVRLMNTRYLPTLKSNQRGKASMSYLLDFSRLGLSVWCLQR